jgi:UDP-glucose 4-epimerase
MANIFKGKKGLVTGGAGFIGSHIVAELSLHDWHVIIIDNLSTGRKENIEPFLNQKNVEFILGSVTDLPLLQKHFSNVDYVFHEAAIPSVPRSIENPIASHEANVTGTLNVLTAAKDQKVKKLVFASSSSVYVDTPALPKQEDMIPNPQSPYAASKIAGEYYCRAFNKVYGLPTVCLRYFNVYGPRQDPNSQYAAVIPKFIRSIMEGKSPVIFGNGEQTRDFTFVRDVVSANILAAESEATGIFNVGRGERITLNELTRFILNNLGRTDIQPVYQADRLGDVKHSLADISRAQTFGYNPQYYGKRRLRNDLITECILASRAMV